MTLRKQISFLGCVVAVLSGCSSKIDPASVRATAGAPLSAVVEEQRIPYDPALPRYVLAVQLPTFPSSTNSAQLTGTAVHSDVSLQWVQQHYNFDTFARVVSAQFTTALSSVGNFSVIDPTTEVPKNLPNGENGPYLVRAQVTAVRSEVVTDKSNLYGIFVMNDEELEAGVAELDIQLIFQGRVVTSFPVQGTFLSKRKKAGVGIVLPFYERKQSAKSLVENAMRVASQNAAKQIFEVLRKK